MSVGEVIESPFAIEESFVGCGEGFDHGHEMAVVVHELQFDGSQMAGIAGYGQCGLSLITISLDQGLEAEALQSLRHGAAVPPQRLRRRLHVKAMLPQTIQHRCIAGRVRKICDGLARPVGDADALPRRNDSLVSKGPSLSAMACSRQCRNSRTLPFHSCSTRARSASFESFSTGLLI